MTYISREISFSCTERLLSWNVHTNLMKNLSFLISAIFNSEKFKNQILSSGIAIWALDQKH